MARNTTEIVFRYFSARDYLAAIFELASHKNNRFSARSFSRSLGIDPAMFRKVIKGERNFSTAMAAAISKKLKLDDEAAIYFQLISQIDGEKDPSARRFLLSKAQNIWHEKNLIRLREDQFELIRSWYALPVFAWLQVPANLPATAKTVSELFNLEESQIEETFRRLDRLGFVKIAQGKIVATDSQRLMFDTPGVKALQEHHKASLNNAIQNVGQGDPLKKFMGTENVVLSDDQIEMAKIILDEACNKIVNLARQGSNPNRMYHLNISFFNLFQEQISKIKGASNA